MRKKNTARLTSIILSAVLLMSNIATSVATYADTDTAWTKESQETKVDAEANAATEQEEENDSSLLTENNDSQDDNKEETDEGGTDTEDTDQQDTPSDKNDNTDDTDTTEDLATVPLSSVIAANENGNYAFYTTLYDGEGRVVDTDDPDDEKDIRYKSTDEGGEGGTLDPEATVKVKLTMPDLVENDGATGIQEDTLYYMDIPEELIPSNTEDTQLIDPEEMITFFSSGDLQCKGGIYTTDTGYQIRCRFYDVADELDVSASYQYEATLSPALNAGEAYTVGFLPGSDVSFTVTPQATPTPIPQEEKDSLKVSGKNRGTENDWTLTFFDTDAKAAADHILVSASEGNAFYSDTQGSPIDGLTLTVTYTDGSTEILQSAQLGTSVIGFYRDGTTMDATCTDDGERGLVASVYTDPTDAENLVDQSGAEQTKYLTKALHIDLGGLKSSSDRGNISGSEDAADLDLGIAKYELSFITTIYDDYQWNGQSASYSISATMTDNTLSASDSVTAGYELSTPEVKEEKSSDVKNMNQAASVTTTITSNGSNLSHYSMQFTPAKKVESDDNYTRAYYFTKNGSFYPSSSSKLTDTFSEFTVGDLSIGDFAYYQTITPDAFASEGVCASCFDGDVTSYHQFKKVFSDADSDKPIMIYRAYNESSEKYVYLVIDQDTVQTAMEAKNNNGWSIMKDPESVLPKGWKIHIFNANSSKINISFVQTQESFYVADADATCTIGDTVRTESAVCGTTPTCYATGTGSYELKQEQATRLKGSYIDADLIFWEYTFSVKDIKDQIVNTCQWYFKLSGNQEFASASDTVNVSDYSLPGNVMYYYDQNNAKWLPAVMCPENKKEVKGVNLEEDGSPNDTSSMIGTIYSDSNISNLIRSLADSASGDQPVITLGFVTKVTDKTKDTTCETELIPAYRIDNTQVSYTGVRYKATDRIPDIGMVKTHKNSSVEENTDGSSSVIDQWTVNGSVDQKNSQHGNDLLDKTETGYIYGTYSIHDDMKDSSATEVKKESKDGAGNGGVKNETGSAVNPAKYTSLTGMNILISGASYTLSSSDINKCLSSSDHTSKAQLTADVTCTLTYSGNMYDGFDLELNNLGEDVFFIQVNYKTSFQQKEFFEAVEKTGENVNDYYDVKLKNTSQCLTTKDCATSKATATTTHSVVASLAIYKEVTTPADFEEAGENYASTYTLETQIGYTSAPSLTVSDFVTGFASTKEDTSAITDREKPYNLSSDKWVSYHALDGTITSYSEDGTENNASDAETVKKAMADLMKSSCITKFDVSVSGPGMDETRILTMALQNGRLTTKSSDDDWTVDLKTPMGDDEYAGKLFDLVLGKTNGQNIPADTVVAVTYTYEAARDSEAEDIGVSDLKDSAYYQGGYLQVSNNAYATMPFSSEETGDTTLKVYCDAKEGGEGAGEGINNWLLGPVLGTKTLTVQTLSDNTFDVITWTGAHGKDLASSKMNDILDLSIDDFSYTDRTTGEVFHLSDMAEGEDKDTYVEKLRRILYHHTQITNFKTYYTKDKEYRTDRTEKTFATDLNIGYVADTSGSGNKRIKDFLRIENGLEDNDKVEGYNPLTYAYSVIYASDPDENGNVTYSATEDDTHKRMLSVLDVETTDLQQDRYVSYTYDVAYDIAGFFEELGVADLSPSLECTPSNGLYDENNECYCMATGSRVQITGTTLDKNVVDTDKENGTATWKVETNTGYTPDDEITISDSISATEDVFNQALGIDSNSIVVSSGDETIWQDEKIVSDKYTDDNISVSVDGRQMTVTIRNTDGHEVLTSMQSFVVTYGTTFDKSAFTKNGGQFGSSATPTNTATLTNGKVQKTTTAQTEITPVSTISASKKYIGTNNQDAATAVYSVIANTGDASRKELTLTDTFVVDDSLAGLVSVEDINVKVGDKTYSSKELPEDIILSVADHSLTAVIASVDKDTDVILEYSLRLDRKGYSKANGSEEKEFSIANTCTVSAKDGSTAEASSNEGVLCYTDTLKKEGKKLDKTSESGNTVIGWTVTTDLYASYTTDEIKALGEVTLVDTLNATLNTDLSSVKLTDNKGNEIPTEAYEVVQEGKELKVTMKDPSSYPAFALYFETECLASLGSLSNTVALAVDGTQTKEATTKVKNIVAAGQNGHIVSSKAPSYTPTAYKYLDSELCTTKGMFAFSVTEVDKNGNIIENGYSAEATNDGSGKIVFDTIRYKKAGTCYYQFKETSEVQPYTYTLDTRVFTVRVDVQKTEDGYVVSESVTSPESYDLVRFDNATITTRDFAVTKLWDDEKDKMGIRPESVVVHLLNNGERYNNMSVVLSEANNWTYTWEDLPIAGGNYSVEEDPVIGYSAATETGDWSIALTNRIDKGDLTVEKKLTGNAGNNDTFEATITLTDGESIFDLSGTFGDAVFTNGIAKISFRGEDTVTIKGLPAGVTYTVTEDDYTEEGYLTPVYENETGTIGSGKETTVTISNTKLEYTPTAVKYLDGEKCDKEGLFSFSLTEADENGNTIENGYSDSATNDSNGVISFRTITYDGPGTYYYQIRETTEAGPYTYTTDDTVYTVKVDITEESGVYKLLSSVISPEDTEIARFDNKTITTRDYTVTKVWDDNDNAYGFRPDSIEVYLLNSGERVSEDPVILSEENNWTHTWKDLPISGSNYTVEEKAATGYTTKIESGDWSSVITNTANTGNLVLKKTVKGNAPEKEYAFTITLKESDEENAKIFELSGTFGTAIFENGVAHVTLKVGEKVDISNLPAGIGYEVTEDDYTEEGYLTPVYENETGIIQAGATVNVSITNTYKKVTPSAAPTAEPSKAPTTAPSATPKASATTTPSASAGDSKTTKNSKAGSSSSLKDTTETSVNAKTGDEGFILLMAAVLISATIALIVLAKRKREEN